MEMSVKERWSAAVDMQPVDRLPFWPKLDGAYPPAQIIPFRNMNMDAIHKWIGSDNHIWVSACIKEVHHNTSCTDETGDGSRRRIFRTPIGECEERTQFDAASNSWHPIMPPVQTLEDIKIMIAYYENLTAEVNTGAVEQAKAAVDSYGDGAFVGAAVGGSPLMRWVEWLAGVENAHLLLEDHQDEVETLFQAMHKLLLREVEIASENCPADILYLIEDTSTTTISPTQFDTYCVKHIRDYGDIAVSMKRRLALHTCGHLKALLPSMSRLPVVGFEAFTSPPVGNTSLLDGRTACPDKCLIGGSNAALWTQSAEKIIEQIERDLDKLPHHRGVVLTSGGVMPPIARPETIRTVCEWVKRYQVRS